MDYVPQDRRSQVGTLLKNYRNLRQILEEICQINRELLRRREKL
jgi:hypothetical protein